MTKIITSENRIIFDGHAKTKEECETISLACEELAKSDKFRTVKYGSGYAEFEKVGSARELKFLATYITTICSNDGATQLGNITTDSDHYYITSTGVRAGDDMRYWEYTGTKTFLGCSTVKNASTPEYGVGSSVPSTVQVLYIVESDPTPTISFKHRFKNDTLIGTGTYKFRRYSVEEPTPLPQLSAPTNVSVTGTTVSFNSVENATSYDILVDGTSIGTYTP